MLIRLEFPELQA